MSRFQVTVTNGSKCDTDGALGYDKPLRTFYLQGFIEKRNEIWLGAFLEEYPTLDSLISAAEGRGYSVSGITHADMIVMLSEAGEKPTPSVGELLGIVR